MKFLRFVSVAIVLSLTGCLGLVQVKPGADPIVVRAEWTAENAANSIDQFLAWERNNEAELLKHTPAIHAAADNLRDNGETEIKNLRAITKQYKRDRDTAGGERVKAATNALLAIANSVRGHMGLPPLTLPDISPSATDLMRNTPTNGPPSTP